MRMSVPLVPIFLAALLLGGSVPRAEALEKICDVANEDCRAPLLDLINKETVGIDVSFWFMEDTRYASAIVSRWNAGVPVRVLMDTEANCCYNNATALSMLRNAGIPMREKTSPEGILHWKLMLFVGQNTVEFSGANYSEEGFVPQIPYANYVDEVIYFTDKPSYVNSFKSRYDDAWTDTTKFTNYANISGPLTRNYPTYTQDPELNWVPWQSFASRSVSRYNAEKLTTYPSAAIDAIMYRITDRRHTDAIIAAVQRGVPVRLITEPLQYRDVTRLWDSWNVDRMYMAGVQVRMRKHDGLSHEKLTILYGQQMTVFGSSNWTSASAEGQHEHNIFTTDSAWFTWAIDHFNRKWNNLAPGGIQETEPFTPLPPDTAVLKTPVNGAQNQATSVTLKWYAGPWAHKYDVYFGTDPSSLAKIVDNRELGPSQSSTDYKTWSVSGLAESTTYYWKVVSRTMADIERTSATASFRTTGAPPAAGPQDVVLYAWRSTNAPGWTVTTDSSAAGGKRLANVNLNAPRVDAPLAEPTKYFDLGFSAEAGVPYRLWIRGKAAGNDYPNDSVWVQFSDSVSSAGTDQWRMRTTSAAMVEIEDCVSCGLADWGWQDTSNNSAGALGPLVYFSTAGEHTIRVQVREDGLSIDQIMLSREAFLSTAPGSPKSDGTIYGEQGGVALPPPPPPPSSGLPTGWSTADIGSIGIPGSASYSNGQFTLQASGSDIWGTSDAFRYVYQTLTGNGSIVALVSSLTNTDVWTKGGVMIRESLTPGSAHATMFVSAAKGLSFQRRVTAGGISTATAGPASAAPYWVKVERSGNVITASRSTTGSSWAVVGTETIALPETVYVGLALTSHNNSALATGTFDAIAISTSSTPPPPPPPPPPPLPSGWTFTDVGAVGAAGSGSESSGTYTVKGAGADTWGTADAFGYAYTTLTGNGEMIARVASVQNVNSWTKAGVMFRDGSTAGAAHGFMISTPTTIKGTAFQRRVTAGGVSTHTAGPVVAPPYWLKLARSGNTITASASADGNTWTVVGTDTIVMGPTISVGLAVSSHVSGALATATFDNVAVTALP
jgi:phosphatidylserine/phosphatidylglycerophosphate/cardiolipin synthase-like enzyme/regulation of enolase protein 1 (concanavalin A-like superfamily)